MGHYSAQVVARLCAGNRVRRMDRAGRLRRRECARVRVRRRAGSSLPGETHPSRAFPACAGTGWGRRGGSRARPRGVFFLGDHLRGGLRDGGLLVLLHALLGGALLRLLHHGKARLLRLDGGHLLRVALPLGALMRLLRLLRLLRHLSELHLLRRLRHLLLLLRLLRSELGLHCKPIRVLHVHQALIAVQPRSLAQLLNILTLRE